MKLLNATIYQRSNDPESPREGVSFSSQGFASTPQTACDQSGFREARVCGSIAAAPPSSLGSAPCPASIDTKNSCHKKYYYLLEQRCPSEILGAPEIITGEISFLAVWPNPGHVVWWENAFAFQRHTYGLPGFLSGKCYHHPTPVQEPPPARSGRALAARVHWQD